MGHEYALEWLDQMVNELDPRKINPENLDNDRSTAIMDKAAKEEKRLILLFKQFVFQERKNRQIKNLVNHHLSAAAGLMETASNYLNQIPTSADNFRLALGSILSCLNEVSAFIVKRYTNLVDRDMSLNKACINPHAHDLHKLRNSDIMQSNPELSELVIGAFDDVFLDERGGEITLRKLEYWASVNQAITSSGDSKKMTGAFDRLEVIMIERNFNSPLFIKYLTSKFPDALKVSGNHPQVSQSLTYLQKTFNQIPVMKNIAFDNHFDDLSLTINTWFIQEIDFQLKASNATLSELGEKAPKTGKRYERKTSDKVLCNLTVDQLSLFFKAADLSNIISARSLSAIFQSVAPHLSTPHRSDISHSSLRVKSYSAEERDKQLLLDVIDRLVEQIKEL
ncbi:hypothetical protein [Dyadobacter luticola]|uniref:Uncharacterized protein n=1 Tax=Dyadobacter luticola TaxID=1979387 RepID=A0A5R9KZ05_9BACT|nr:hypothetical protein [Dyadobacter luticola]TLV01339.1 hypothetical protein FEN17_18050 [Dyadobacter luticola]